MTAAPVITPGPTPGQSPIVRLFYERTGIEFSPARHRSIEHGIRRAMARAGAGDEAQFADRLGRDQAAFDDLVAELTVGETYFFRAPQQFAFIRGRILPELRRRRGTEQPIRVWSSACSTGEEPYSLAMMLEEEGLGDQSTILATDISRAALRKAGAATYSSWSFRATEAQTLARYFHAEGNRQALDPRIRQRVNFAYLNLSTDVYPSAHNDTWGADLLFCRNVLIYFSPEVVARVCRQLFECVAEGGWLITAPTDPPLDHYVPCEVVVDDLGVFYRRGKARAGRPLVPGRTRHEFPSDLPRQAQEPTGPTGPDARTLEIIVPQNLGVPAAGSGGAGAPMPPELPASLRPVVPSTPPLESSPESPGDLPADDAATGELARVSALLGSGDYAGALAALASAPRSPDTLALRTRILANVDPALAVACCVEAVGTHPLSIELNYLHAVLLLHAGRVGPCAAALRRTLYLDPTLSIAHFVLGTVLQRQGRPGDARRAYRNARDLCDAQASEDELPLGEGETAGRLAEVAGAQMSVLEG